MLNSIAAFAELHPDLPSVTKRLQSAYIELQDIADEIDRINAILVLMKSGWKHQ
jgi:DNA repair protein RecN (Recombination protein N)